MSRSLAEGSGGGGVAAVVVFGGTDGGGGGGSMAAPDVKKRVRYFSLFFLSFFIFLVVDGRWKEGEISGGERRFALNCFPDS